MPLRKADGSPLPELSVDVPTVLDGTGATTASKRVTGPGIAPVADRGELVMALNAVLPPRKAHKVVARGAQVGVVDGDAGVVQPIPPG